MTTCTDLVYNVVKVVAGVAHFILRKCCSFYFWCSLLPSESCLQDKHFIFSKFCSWGGVADQLIVSSSYSCTCSFTVACANQGLVKFFSGAHPRQLCTVEPCQQHPVSVLPVAVIACGWSWISPVWSFYYILFIFLFTAARVNAKACQSARVPVHCCSMADICSIVKPQCSASLFQSAGFRSSYARRQTMERNCLVSKRWSGLNVSGYWLWTVSISSGLAWKGSWIISAH